MQLGKLSFLGLAFFALLAFFASPGVFAAEKEKQATMDPENVLYIDIPFGRVTVVMRPDLAPNHVKRIKELVRQGFYNDLPFHRVIERFMAQTGDPKGDGTGGSGQKLKAEFSKEHHLRGTVSMARAADPDSADSQFFICLADAPHLDGNYTVWGQVVSGMEAIDMIKKGETFNNGIVNDPTKMLKVQVAADVKK